jgi:hypothetical protein
MEKTNTGKRPGRYKLYDKIKLKVSLHTMNIVIVVIIALIFLAVVVGLLV